MSIEYKTITLTLPQAWVELLLFAAVDKGLADVEDYLLMMIVTDGNLYNTWLRHGHIGLPGLDTRPLPEKVNWETKYLREAVRFRVGEKPEKKKPAPPLALWGQPEHDEELP